MKAKVWMLNCAFVAASFAAPSHLHARDAEDAAHKVCRCRDRKVKCGQSTTVYRDASGRMQGTVTTDSSGKTTYRDALGRIEYTQTVDKNGKITCRDALGRVIWTKTAK